MGLVQSDYVIQQVSAAALDPALCNPVLPRTSETGPHRTQCQRPNPSRNLNTLFRVAIKDQELCGWLQWKCFSSLLDDPQTRRVPRHIEVQNLATVMADDEKAVEDPERHGGHSEEIHRGNRFSVIPQEREPLLCRFGISRGPPHPTRNRSFANIEP